jgi:hypothetical protein
VDPVPDLLAQGIELGTSGSVARNSDHWNTVTVVSKYINKITKALVWYLNSRQLKQQQ